MANYTITKDFGTGKANTQAKAELIQVITDALIAYYGEDNVAMVRTGTSTQTNEIGVRIGTLTDIDGFEYDFCATVNPTIKGYKEKITKRYTVAPFEFETAKQAYIDYVEDKERTAKENAEKKAKKIERDKAMRAEKAKANAERLVNETK